MKHYVLEARHPNPVFSELKRDNKELIQDLAASPLNDEEANAARKLGSAFLRLGHAGSNTNHMAILAKTIFPQEQTRLDALNRMIGLLDDWKAEAEQTYKEVSAAREKRLAFKKQHSLGVSVYWQETVDSLQVIKKRIERWVKSSGLSESGASRLDDLIQRGHKREELLKIYPPKVSLEELKAEEQRLLGVLEEIERFNKEDIPTSEFLESMPKHLRDLRPTNWTQDIEEADL